MSSIPRLYVMGAGLAAAGVVAFYLYARTRGGVAAVAGNMGQAAGAAVVGAAGGAASGAVGAVGAAVGLPTPSQTVTDPAEARWLIDNAGHWQASQWSGAFAYMRALAMEPGSGRKPGADTAAGQQFAGLVPKPTDTGDEAARLAIRYPAPAQPSTGGPSVFDGYGSFEELAQTPQGFTGLFPMPGYGAARF